MTEEMDNILLTTENQHWVDAKNALERLEDNPDFKLVIEEGYCKNKALGAVSMLARPETRQRNERGAYMEELNAISNLQYFFMMIKNIGSSAESDMLEEIEEGEA